MCQLNIYYDCDCKVLNVLQAMYSMTYSYNHNLTRPTYYDSDLLTLILWLNYVDERNYLYGGSFLLTPT